jgi:hypothetical protein
VKRIIVVGLSIGMLLFILACGAADMPHRNMTQQQVEEACRKDPKCVTRAEYAATTQAINNRFEK